MHEVEIPVSMGFFVQKLWPGTCLWTAPVRPNETQVTTPEHRLQPGNKDPLQTVRRLEVH